MDTARELSFRLARLLGVEHAALAEFLVALSDFDRRRHWVELGYTSLFWYLHRELGLSKSAAFHRKLAAELLQRFPALVEPLRDGRLCLSSLAELAKVLTPENQVGLLPRFFHRSAREAREVSAELRPRVNPPAREVVTAGPWPRDGVTRKQGSTSEPPIGSGDAESPAAPLAAAAIPTSLSSPTPTPTSTVEPLTADLRRLHVTVTRGFLQKLDAARDGLSHAIPGASSEQVLEAALDLLLAQQAKRRGEVKKPLAKPRPSSSDRIPAHVRREVWKRDGGRCQWPLATGGICGSTVRLQFDHVVPRARGGLSTVANVRLLCGCHNLLSARQVYGEAWMNQFALGP